MRASDVIGRRIVSVEQGSPPSATYGREHAVTLFRLDDGSVVHFVAVDDPTGDQPYVTANVRRLSSQGKS